MATSTQQLEIPDVFRCGITGDLMSDPALTVYGNYFEYSAIRRWLERNNTCPVTKKPLLRHMIRREPELKEAIAEFRAMLDETKSSQPQSIAIRGSSTTTTTPATSLLAPSSSSSSSTTIATTATSVPAPSISSSGTVITMDSFHVSPRHSGDAMSFYDSPGSSIDSEPDDSMVPSQVDCSSFGAAQAVAASVSASASSRRYRGHSRSASASASASTSASASATGSPFHAEPGSHTMVTIENLPTLLAESLQPLADPTELSSSSSPPSSPMRNDLTDSGGKSATVVIQQPPPQQQQQQPLQQPLNAATAAVSLVSYHGSLAKRSKQRRKRTGSLQLMAHQQVNALGLTSTSPTSEGSAFAANMFPAGGHSSLGTAGGAAAIAAIAAAGGALLPNMHSASYPSMLPPEYLHAASASIAIQQQLSGGGSGTSPPSATAGLSSSPSTGSEEKGTNYYNQQLLNRGVDRGGLQPTRESLSSSTFASKLLKAASTKRSEGRLSEHGFDGAIKDQGLVVQWLWRAPSSWQAYSTFDHDRLEEAYQNDRNRQQNIVVDQGRAFVSVTERVHVSLSNGRRFRVIRGTWFIVSTRGVFLPLEEQVAEELEEYYQARKYNQYVRNVEGDQESFIVLESDTEFREYLRDGNDALVPSQRRVERGFMFVSIT